MRRSTPSAAGRQATRSQWLLSPRARTQVLSYVAYFTTPWGLAFDRLGRGCALTMLLSHWLWFGSACLRKLQPLIDALYGTAVGQVRWCAVASDSASGLWRGWHGVQMGCAGGALGGWLSSVGPRATRGPRFPRRPGARERAGGRGGPRQPRHRHGGDGRAAEPDDQLQGAPMACICARPRTPDYTPRKHERNPAA
eukprot:2537175-Prymnesium_polylepis.2